MNLRRTLAATSLLALTLTGCQAAGEQLAEQAAEMAGGENVDIEVDDDGGVSVETADGSLSSGGELPDDLPDLPLLEDGDLLNASRYEDDAGTSWTVNYQHSSGELGETVEVAVQQLLDAGFSMPEGGDGDFDMSGDGGGMAGRVLENDEYTVTVTAFGESGDFILGYQIIRRPTNE